MKISIGDVNLQANFYTHDISTDFLDSSLNRAEVRIEGLEVQPPAGQTELEYLQELFAQSPCQFVVKRDDNAVIASYSGLQLTRARVYKRTSGEALVYGVSLII